MQAESTASKSIWRGRRSYNAQSQLLNNENSYADALDNFKLQFGLPPSLDVKISDPLLDHFNLLDPDLTQLQIRLADLLTDLREGALADTPEGVQDQQPILPGQSASPVKDAITKPVFDTLVKRSAQIKAASEARLAAAQLDLARLEAALPAQRAFLKRLSVRKETKEANIDPDLVSVERLNQRFEDTKQEYILLSKRLAEVWARVDTLTGVTSLPLAEHRTKLINALNQLSGALLELSLLQARARLDAITFEPVDLSDDEAYCIASRYRRDWMNARASVVDAWRLIQFNANSLESDLDLVFSGDLQNHGDAPFDLRGSNGRLRVGLQFDPPLTRLAERNTYRQSLIEYQQANRSYYQFRDRIQRNLRSILRQMKLDDLNFELRRAAVRTAITQVDLARLRLSEPARPVPPSAPGQPTEPGGQSQFGDTVARDLVNALIDLLNVQNDFLSVWVDHEVQDLNLDYELGTMELDGRGIRIEHDQPLRTYLTNLPCTAPCEEPNPCADMQCEGMGVGAASNSTVETTEESDTKTPRPSPSPRGMEGPALQGPSSTGQGAELLPPPSQPSPGGAK